MKATLEFNLDEPDDRLEHERCIKSLDMALSLWEILYNSKRDIEYKLDNKDKYEVLDMVYERIYQVLEEHNVNIDRLIE